MTKTISSKEHQIARGVNPCTAAPGYKLSRSGNSFDNYVSQQELGSSRNGMSSIGFFQQ